MRRTGRLRERDDPAMRRAITPAEKLRLLNALVASAIAVFFLAHSALGTASLFVEGLVNSVPWLVWAMFGAAGAHVLASRFDADRHRAPTEFPQEAPLRAEVGNGVGFGGDDCRTSLLHPLPWQPSCLSPSDEGVFPAPPCRARLACRHRDEIPCPRPRNREGNARCRAGCLRADCFRPNSPCGAGFLNSTAMCWAYRMEKEAQPVRRSSRFPKKRARRARIF